MTATHGRKAESKHLAKVLNRGEYEEMPDLIKGFVASRVPDRRISEARLFALGVYDATH